MDSPKIFLFGATSLAGWNLFRRHGDAGIVPFCNPYTRAPACQAWQRLRLEDEDAVRGLFETAAPDILIHCGGVCDVDQSEAHPEWAREINVDAVEMLLRVLPKSTRLVYCSSDHVFGGRDEPYDERDPPDPISVYGRHRVLAENAIRSGCTRHLIVRFGLPIGPSVDGRKGHWDWLKYRTLKGLPTTVVPDEFRSAVWAEDLAGRIMDLARSEARGVRHVPATQCVSRLALAEWLNHRFEIGATLRTQLRAQREIPHLGRVELRSRYDDALGRPLSSVLDSEVS